MFLTARTVDKSPFHPLRCIGFEGPSGFIRSPKFSFNLSKGKRLMLGVSWL
jgi:hypothetical protein